MSGAAHGESAGAGGLTVDDILDLRAYERVRDRFRAAVLEVKRRRRVPLGRIMTLAFESVDTVRLQVQEMARVERIATDEGIAGELEVYNRLLPAPGELSATLFIELTSEEELRTWLPRLVGIERHVLVQLGGDTGGGAGEHLAGGRGPAPGSVEVRSVPEASHAAALTRESVTPAVHYLRFPFTEDQVALLADPQVPAALVVDHPAYAASTPLGPETRAELLADLQGRTEPISLD